MAMLRAFVIAAWLAAAGVAAAQDLPILIEGRVAWMAGAVLVLAPDGNASVNIDISQVPQDQRATLREGDRIVVAGAADNERRRVIASTITRIGPLTSR
jgi:hypothetical protein